LILPGKQLDGLKNFQILRLDIRIVARAAVKTLTTTAANPYSIRRRSSLANHPLQTIAIP